MKIQTAQLRYLRIAPRKVRLLAHTLKGLSVTEAEAQLLLRTQRARLPLLKLLRSAAANAKENQKLAPANLFVKGVWVNEGPMLKRSLPRAQGSATPIHKKMSHVTVVLEEMATPRAPRFTIVIPEKKKKSEKGGKKKPAKPRTEEQPRKAAPETKKPGFFRKFFRRKSMDN